MNAQIRQRAKQILENNLGTFLIAGFIFACITYIANRFGNNSGYTYTSGSLVAAAGKIGNGVGTIIRGTITAFVSAAQACFYFRAFNRGRPELGDIIHPVSGNETSSAFFRILLSYWIIFIGMVVLTALSIFLIWFLAPVLLALGVIILNLVWYLFAANPYYPTRYYFKAVFRYLGNHIFGYIFFMIGTVLLPALGIGLVALIPILGALLVFIGSAILSVYAGLAGAGYINAMIPDEWFSGTATF